MGAMTEGQNRALHSGGCSKLCRPISRMRSTWSFGQSPTPSKRCIRSGIPPRTPPRPAGLQIVGPLYADALVLRAARAYETAQPFKMPAL